MATITYVMMSRADTISVDSTGSVVALVLVEGDDATSLCLFSDMESPNRRRPARNVHRLTIRLFLSRSFKYCFKYLRREEKRRHERDVYRDIVRTRINMIHKAHWCSNEGTIRIGVTAK